MNQINYISVCLCASVLLKLKDLYLLHSTMCFVFSVYVNDICLKSIEIEKKNILAGEHWHYKREKHILTMKTFFSYKNANSNVVSLHIYAGLTKKTPYRLDLREF